MRLKSFLQYKVSHFGCFFIAFPKAKVLGKMAKTSDQATAWQCYPQALGPKKCSSLRHSVKPELAVCIPAFCVRAAGSARSWVQTSTRCLWQGRSRHQPAWQTAWQTSHTAGVATVQRDWTLWSQDHLRLQFKVRSLKPDILNEGKIKTSTFLTSRKTQPRQYQPSLKLFSWPQCWKCNWQWNTKVDLKKKKEGNGKNSTWYFLPTNCFLWIRLSVFLLKDWNLSPSVRRQQTPEETTIFWKLSLLIKFMFYSWKKSYCLEITRDTSKLEEFEIQFIFFQQWESLDQRDRERTTNRILAW